MNIKHALHCGHMHPISIAATCPIIDRRGQRVYIFASNPALRHHLLHRKSFPCFHIYLRAVGFCKLYTLERLTHGSNIESSGCEIRLADLVRTRIRQDAVLVLYRHLTAAGRFHPLIHSSARRVVGLWQASNSFEYPLSSGTNL